MNNRIYIAIPYTGNEMLSNRVSNMVTAWFVDNTGFVPISPISMYHHLAHIYEIKSDFERWKSINFGLIDACSKMLVIETEKLKIDESKGVLAEIEYAQSKGIEIHKLYVNPYKGIESLANSPICTIK
jgi:hypothetical protein